MWCLFEIFGHFNFQYCLHLIPYYIFTELLKLKSYNFETEDQNTVKEISISLTSTQQKEKAELSVEIAENKTIQNYNNDEINTTKEDRMVSDVYDISIPRTRIHFQVEWIKTRYIKKFTPSLNEATFLGKQSRLLLTSLKLHCLNTQNTNFMMTMEISS
ncbi:hypothetical protein TNCT_277631 [Trichonephila clavata]|uniref:Uncharacterized protein n=1 Tax=Trichonephila clavata TaxID=2740835 RepID=A0A8X6M156_TRICU|nr:hypothetical protein TNCT_277631 [Trichonephila clavata]